MTTALVRRVTIKRIRNPDNEDQFIDWRVADQVEIRTGSGPTYERRIVRFENRKREDEDENPTGRIIEEFTVTHHALNEDGTENTDDSDDEDQKLEVERLKGYITKTGSGPTFKRNIHELATPEDEDSTRVTHRKRIHAKLDPDDPESEDDEDVWADDERVDQITFVSGSGPDFKRETIFFEWSDQENDEEQFDDLEGELIEDEEPPYRSSPIQNIVNVQWTPKFFILLRALAENRVDGDDPPLALWRVIEPVTGAIVEDGTGLLPGGLPIGWITDPRFTGDSDFNPRGLPENSDFHVLDVAPNNSVYISGGVDGFGSPNPQFGTIKKYLATHALQWTSTFATNAGSFTVPIAADNKGVIAVYDDDVNLVSPALSSTPYYLRLDGTSGTQAWQFSFSSHPSYSQWRSVAFSFGPVKVKRSS